MNSIFPACRRHLPRISLAAILLASIGAPSAHAQGLLEIDEVVWGFDGTVMQNHFAPLSLLVRNSSAETVDVTMELRRMRNLATTIDAPIVEPIFLGPFSSRWVQFYPYVPSIADEWVVSWGRLGHERFTLPQPSFAGRARVALRAESALVTTPPAWKPFTESLFPPLVTATDGLDAILLDHVPRWEEGRRTAFLDWLHAGGRVVIAPDHRGQMPEFPPTLALLNVPVDRQRVGAGEIFRLDQPANQLTVDSLNELLGAPSEERSGQEAWQSWNQDSPINAIPFRLRQMTRPEHNWPLIHFMSWVYLAIIFPGFFILARKRVGYRTGLLGFAAVALVFCYLFHIVGRRGYGERTSVHSVALARPLPDGQQDVMQWSNIFVTSGGIYEIRHPGDSHLFSAAQDIESVPGQISNGHDGKFTVRLPLFSSRFYIRRGRVPSVTPTMNITRRATDQDPGELELAPGPAFPATARATHIYYRGRFYELTRQENSYKAALGAGRSLEELRSNLPMVYDYWQEGDARLLSMYFENLIPYLLLHAAERLSPATPDDLVRVYVYTPMDDNYLIDSQQFPQETGYVLHELTLPLPEPSS